MDKNYEMLARSGAYSFSVSLLIFLKMFILRTHTTPLPGVGGGDQTLLEYIPLYTVQYTLVLFVG